MQMFSCRSGVQDEGDDLHRFAAGVLHAVAGAGGREGHVASGDGHDRPIVVELTAAAIDIVGFRLAGVDMEPDAAAGQQGGVREHAALAVELFVVVGQVPYGDKAVRPEFMLRDLYVPFIALAYHAE